MQAEFPGFLLKSVGRKKAENSHLSTHLRFLDSRVYFVVGCYATKDFP